MRVGTGIYRAESKNEVVYALECGEGAFALVDVGGAAGLDAKLEQLRADGVDCERIAAAFLTHNHDDHCGALARLLERCPTRIVAHRLAVQTMGHCLAVKALGRELVHYTVDDGDTVEVGEVTLQAHHLPGHTADSTAWQMGTDFFVGDITFEWGGIGWMDVHWGSCVSDYRASLQQLYRLKPGMLYPGHGNPVEMSRELLDKALANLNALAEADGSPVNYLGQRALRRGKEVAGTTIRLSTGPPRQ